MFINRGNPAPEPTNTASYPISNSSSMVSTLPMTISVWISTPSSFKFSISCCTIALGRRNSGMPYTSTPPARCSASKIVTSYPSFARSPAAVSPDAACADHRNLVTVGSGLLYGLLAVLPVPVRHEPLQTPDSHRITLDPAYAFALALALLRAHPAAHRRQAG